MQRNLAQLTEKINRLSSEIKELEKQQRVQRDTIGLRFNELKEKLKVTFSTASLNELSFLEFKTITASGTVSNVTLFSIYIIYLRLLSEYSVVELDIFAPSKSPLLNLFINLFFLFSILEFLFCDLTSESETE